MADDGFAPRSVQDLDALPGARLLALRDAVAALAASPRPSTKKLYTPPTLVTYGHVKDLVQGNAGRFADAGTTRRIFTGMGM